MRLFHDTIAALGAAQQSERDGFIVVDEAVGWAKLLRVQGEVKELANLADEDPLRGAADRYLTLRKFGPELIEAMEFKATRINDPTLSALRLLRDLNRSGKRDVPPDAPMPFRKDWKRLVSEGGRPNRRLYETAVFATLATSSAPVTSGLSDHPTIAASTATSCRRQRCPRSRPNWACLRPPMSGSPRGAPNSTAG
jgi:hypothetical protein